MMPKTVPVKRAPHGLQDWLEFPAKPSPRPEGCGSGEDPPMLKSVIGINRWRSKDERFREWNLGFRIGSSPYLGPRGSLYRGSG